MDVISESYRQQQTELHEKGNYGVTGGKYAPLVSEIINRLEVQHVLDYGCGRNLSLMRALKADHKFKYQAYDPAVEAFSSDPAPAEMVCCIDVLEHIEPDKIENVLDHLMELTEAVAFITVSTGPAMKVLSDGRNAHLIQQPAEWWLPRLMARFDLHTFQVSGTDSFYCVLYARGAIENAEGTKLS